MYRPREVLLRRARAVDDRRQRGVQPAHDHGLPRDSNNMDDNSKQ